MGQKVHPYAFRLGFIKNWKSRWFSKNKYKELLEQDYLLRAFILKKLSRTGVNSVEIERSANFINIVIQTARPGLVIGRGGAGIEELKKEIERILFKKDPSLSKTEVKLEVEEIRDSSSRAAVMASDICVQIEKRTPYRRVLKQTIDKIMQSREVKGAKIMVSGRLNGAEIARREWLKEGRIPLQTLRSDIDYVQATAYTTYGTIGIKVWIYKGEIFKDHVATEKSKA